MLLRPIWAEFICTEVDFPVEEHLDIERNIKCFWKETTNATNWQLISYLMTEDAKG